MKRILFLLLFFVSNLMAHDGHGGGGGGGGHMGGGGGFHGGGGGGGGFHGAPGDGGFHGGGGGHMMPTMQRSPSMSHVSPGFSGSHPMISAPQAHAAVGQPGRQMSQTRMQLSHFLQNRPGTQGHGAVFKAGEGRGTAFNAAQRDHLRQFAKGLRSDIHNFRPNRGEWFNHDFFHRHNFFPPFFGFGNNWWNWATPVAIGLWLGWDAAPIYYDYGQTYVQQPTVPVYQEPVQTTPETSEGDWMPLGVFAISNIGDTAVAPNLYVQLALNKSGEISGTLYNATTDQTYEVEGIVDQNSQRAAWQVVNLSKSPIFETGVYNLTQTEAPLEVYFSDGTEQQMMLLRLEGPTEQSSPSSLSELGESAR